MKIWCDVCSKNKASIFCSADEAALCDECDSRVHQANKLASKHKRFSLLQPSSSQAPLCDICQEKKALLFCHQDRAILCRDCDVQIHTANELTQKHNRFLLTGVKLSALSSTKTAATATATASASKSQAKSDSTSSGFESVPDFRPQNLTTKSPPMSASSEASTTFLNFKAQSTASATITHDLNSQLINSCDSTSSISEYLIDYLPGWQVEDLLDSSSDPNGFLKGCENDLLFMDTNLGSKINSYENMGLWVPQAPNVSQPSPFSTGIYGLGMEKGEMGKKATRKMMDDGFTVPEISQNFVGSKRSRGFY